MERDTPASQLAFMVYIDFYAKHYPGKKKIDFQHFIKSSYYTAFIKFANYCRAVSNKNATYYINWLLDNKIGIDNWCMDTNYSKFVQQHLRVEHYRDAVFNTFTTLEGLAEKYNIRYNDVLRYGNVSTILSHIVKGEISPWVLYKSDPGTEFLKRLDAQEAEYILEYINPELWQVKFLKDAETVAAAQKFMNDLGIK